MADKTFGRLYLLNDASTRLSHKEGVSPLAGESAERHFLCDTLEPTRRDLAGGAHKVAGRTAIPEGRYPLVIARSRRFRRWLPTLVGVPGFKGILIHTGNTELDTRGCILVGTASAGSCLVFSCEAFRRLMRLLEGAGESMWITVSSPSLEGESAPLLGKG